MTHRFLESTAVAICFLLLNCICEATFAMQSQELSSLNKTEASSDGNPIEWADLPKTIHAMPRPGFFQMSASQTSGYYSLWDRLTDQQYPQPPKSGYPNSGLIQYSYFDSDWRYVEKLQASERTWVESLKRMQLNERSMLSVGGNYWVRYMNENNSRLTRTTNTYTLNRLRTYADWCYQDDLRVFGEYLWADSFNEDLTSLTTDVDRGDILNLFIDLKLFEYEDSPVYI